jgi:hypothetical protein
LAGQAVCSCPPFVAEAVPRQGLTPRALSGGGALIVDEH